MGKQDLKQHILHDGVAVRGSFSGPPQPKLQQRAMEHSAREFELYRKESEPFFTYLHARAANLSAEQFCVFRDNIFARVLGTLPALSRTLEAAAYRGDEKTLGALSQTIAEEAGNGHDQTSHLKMLEDAFNFHGKLLYNLSPITLREAESSPFLVDEVSIYRNAQKLLSRDSTYPMLLAATYARETAAQQMLSRFYKDVFLPTLGRYAEAGADFGPIDRYFKSHIEGVEEEHANRALHRALESCRTPNDLENFKTGVSIILHAQSDLWDGMHRRMEQEAVSAVPRRANIFSGIARAFRHGD